MLFRSGIMKENLRPSQAEKEFLSLAYNKFYDIYDEILQNELFWNKDDFYRFSKIREAICIYGEVQLYEPIQWKIENMKIQRPPMEAEIAGELFKCIRNIFSRFPFFDSWNKVWVSDTLLNWNKPNQGIYRFILEYLGHDEVKYRIWDAKFKKMIYLSISFPENFVNKIYLEDIISEKEGVEFSLILMKEVMKKIGRAHV